ncbi:putative polyketide synthase [Triangularia setosa]|uniref:Polyketide synthase n=1 Tax=Triangularia setosa TaxID=2587417 RepID=A0AAN7A392_9PEZI|nr:putative polyketide synthase [Podospora setosa]
MASSSIIDGPHEPVAIIGMGCRWAGGVRDPSGLWDLLKNKRDGWREFNEPRFSAKGFYHPNQDRPGSMRTRGAFLMDEDARLFDHSFFGITGREAETLDPSQRKLLEVVYEAFENGGETWESISGSRTGVYIGNFALDHILIQARDWESPKSYAATGADTSILANRISYIFNLHGPSLATNTACSSSMYALHMAVSAIRSGDCDGAIVAAANWIADPSMQFVLDKLGALSPTARCHTFDASADGYARGEGYAALYLKKSSLAILDSLPIRAMIRGTAINANGRTGGITRPSITGQEDVIREAYKHAGNLPFSDTTFFECHGTGTQAGDPIEVTAVGNVFASSRSDAPEDRLLIGSIKPNLGHTEGASAIASVMKVVLSLEAGQIPPTFGIERLNPSINFGGAKVEVVKDGTVPWPEGRLRRASVNSFGFGGANGHCIIDHVNVVLPGYVKPGVARGGPFVNGQITNGRAINGYPTGAHNGNDGVATPPAEHSPLASKPRKTTRADAATRELVLLPFSAHTEPSLKSNISALSRVINQWSLADVAYTLSSKRSRFQQRSFRIVKKEDVATGLATERRTFTSPLRAANIAYVFTGQGAQWHVMGAQLFEYAVFRAAITHLDHVMDALPSRPAWKISDVLSGNCEPDLVQSPQVSQVACTAVQIGIVDLLASWSIRPVAVVGHSSGEMAAAYASGHGTAAEAITAAYFRGLAVSQNKAKGAMLAVGMGVDAATEYLDGKEHHIKIAAINSPGSVTLSGDADAIESLSVTLNDQGVFNRALRTGGNAYHSHHMVALGSHYSDMLSKGIEHIKAVGLVNKTQRYPLIPWVSSVTPGKPMGCEVEASYWRANLESPVRFSEAVSGLMSLEHNQAVDILVEVGPHPALKSPVDQILKSIGKSAPHIASLKRGEDSRESVLQLAGTLFGLNAEVDLAAVNAVDDGLREGMWSFAHGCTAVDLPGYQYTYGPVNYYESRVSKEYRLRQVLRHDLIGSRLPGASKLRPQWRNVLRLKDVPWLGDHRLLPDAVFPAAGFIAMGIEAATQAYRELPKAHEITGYSLRKVDIETVLRLPEDDRGVDIILSLELADTEATVQSPNWSRFTVSSVARDSDEWTEHCKGLVKVEISEKPAVTGKMDTVMDARFPDTRAWYEKFTEIGIGYGPTFQPLSDIRADPNQNLAQATVTLNTTDNTIEGGESSYALHPAALDGTFQLGLIACYGGQLERAYTAFVPVHLSSMYLKAGLGRHTPATAIARGQTQGLRGAYIQLQMTDKSGDVVLAVDTLRCLSFKESKSDEYTMQSKKAFSSPFARLTWKPDIRALNNDQIRALFPPPQENNEGAASLEVVDMICCLVVADIYDVFIQNAASAPQPKGELRHWVSWLKWCVEEDQRENMVEARSLPTNQRHQLLQKLYTEAGDRPEAQAARRLHQNMGEILAERKTGIDVLVPDGLLTALYETGHVIVGSYPQLSNVLDCLGHANPNMRILEIGAGTGAGTRVAMGALAGPNGIKRYADYTFTDISAGFLTAAQEFMAGYRDVSYAILDIGEDPLANGFEPAYDVVFACEAVHATASMDKTLENCRRLLRPGGKLVLVESTRMRVLLGLLYGTLTGYWLGVNDNRSEGPFMDLATWGRRLRKAGFSGTELVLDDYNHPHNTTSILVSTRLEEPGVATTEDTDAKKHTEAMIHLLHPVNGAPPLLEQVASEFGRCGVKAVVSTLNEASETILPNARIIVFINGENDLFDTNDARRLNSFQHLAQNTKSMIWLTSSGLAKGRDPRAAFMVGLLRTIGTENPAGRFLSIDIDTGDFEKQDDGLIRNIVRSELALQHDDASDEEGSKDREFVWQDGCMWVSRVVPDTELGVYTDMLKTPTSRGSQMVPIGGQGPVRAAFETPGILTSLYFRTYTELLQPLPADYIDVKVAAVGVNWKDLGLTSGRFDANGSNLSSEFAGVVTKVGATVNGLSVGDRVYGVGRGQFGNYTRVPAAFAQKLQPADVLTEMATMPLVYMTAVYAFDYVARLRKGQKVLIQSATGGLGLAAIQIARARGADVFATVGTAEKVSFLRDSVGIPAGHIFFSRDPTALSGAAKATGKGGFDVILSTVVGGDFLRESLRALAPMGHLVDVGRLDVLEAKDIGLEHFQKNATLTSFDLNVVLDNDAEIGRELLKTVDDLYRWGVIAPIRPFAVHDASELDRVLLGMSKGTHIGKLVVSFENPASLVKLVREPPAAKFDSEARYVVTGGLGGLGRAIIKWMVSRGACDFLILSRRGINTPAAQSLVNNLVAQGVRIEAVVCDVSKRGDVVDAVRKASSGNCPVRGVIHAAMALTDLSFDKLSMDQWRDGFAAKALGSLNLHEATLSLPLDFFVMITSTESIWAPPTQAAYIAANNFQDHFARYRRRLGLPASTVAYGLVADVKSDFLHNSVGTDDMYVRNKTMTITEHQVLAQLEPAFLAAETSRWAGREHDPLSEANILTCLDPVGLAELASTSDHIPRWYRDGRVSLIIRAMNDVQRQASGAEVAQDGAGGVGKSAVARLRGAFVDGIMGGAEARTSTVALVTEGVTQTVAAMLFIDASTVDPAKSIAEHGVDSLIAAELRSWFHQVLKTNLKMGELLDAQTSIRALAENIVDEALEG